MSEAKQRNRAPAVDGADTVAPLPCAWIDALPDRRSGGVGAGADVIGAGVDITSARADVAGAGADITGAGHRCIGRRHFLKSSAKSSALLGLAAVCPAGLWRPGAAHAGPFSEEEMRFVAEAAFYERLPHKKIRCQLCPRECVIDEMERGYCGVRENRDGTYYTLVHSRPCTVHADPIEKKPLFHFQPGTYAFSLATAGCNVNCKFCQNWEISQARPEQIRSLHMTPQRVAELAVQNDCRSIAYTYSEPVIFYEYMMDCVAAGHEREVRSVVITGGYIAREPLEALCRQVDAIKVDLKAFSEKFYRDVVGGELQPVLDGLVTMRAAGVWTEIVYLVVPTLNDTDAEFEGLCRWIKENLGVDVPVHFTRFHPQYLLRNLPPTPVKTLERAKEIADAEGLRYVYVGNVPGHPAEHTRCPSCERVIIKRRGFFIEEMLIRGGACGVCGGEIAGVWGG